MAEKAPKARIKEIQALLKEKKERDAKGLFVAEGVKIVRDMADKGCPPAYALISSDFAASADRKHLITRLAGAGTKIFEIGKKDLEKLSSLESSQGILAVLRKKEQPADSFFVSGRKLVVLCDGVQDPGNLGAIFRTSVALGADAIILSGDCADIYNPKVVRSSSGVILDIPVFEYSDALLDRLKNEGYKLLVSMAKESGTKNLRRMKNVPVKLIAAFGSEGQGVSDRVLSKADSFFHIGVNKNVESLNVTVAVAISLFVLVGLPAE